MMRHRKYHAYPTRVPVHLSAACAIFGMHMVTTPTGNLQDLPRREVVVGVMETMKAIDSEYCQSIWNFVFARV